MHEQIFIFFVALTTGFLSGMAGGGTGLISAPLFILMGLPAVSAIATAKFGAIGVVIGGLIKFRKTSYIRKEHLHIFIILTIAGNILGAILLLSLSNEVATKIVACMMVGSLPFLFLKKNAGLVQTATTRGQHYLGYMLYFLISIAQTAFGGGIGMLVPIIMIALFGFTALEASATRKVPAIIGVTLPLIIFMYTDVINYGLGIPMFIGTVIGSYFGTHIAVKQGEGFAKWLLTAVVILMIGKLFFG